MENIWRLELRTAIPKERYSELLKHCFEKKILGIGWRGVDKQDFKKSIEKAYAASAKIKVAERRMFLFSQIEVDDFVWVKSEENFALCRVTKKWYDTPTIDIGDEEAIYYDLFNYVEAEWILFDDLDDVPGFVITAFEGSRATISKMKTNNIITRAIWNIHKKTNLDCSVDINKKEYKDMFWSLISKRNLDNVIAIMLQEKGYYIVSMHNIQTDKTYNPQVTLKHRETGDIGYFFVNYLKSIKVSDFEYLLDVVDDIFFFTPSVYREKIESKKINIIKKQDVIKFIDSRLDKRLDKALILPESIRKVAKLRDKIYQEIVKFI